MRPIQWVNKMFWKIWKDAVCSKVLAAFIIFGLGYIPISYIFRQPPTIEIKQITKNYAATNKYRIGGTYNSVRGHIWICVNSQNGRYFTEATMLTSEHIWWVDDLSVGTSGDESGNTYMITLVLADSDGHELLTKNGGKPLSGDLPKGLYPITDKIITR